LPQEGDTLTLHWGSFPCAKWYTFAPPCRYTFTPPLTLAHETCHWSGAKSRLDRELRGRFGSHAYAAEELIAELGSAFLCADLALTPEPREDHAAYLQTWLTVLKSDRRAIFAAAAHAERAAGFLHSLQPQAAVAGDLAA